MLCESYCHWGRVGGVFLSAFIYSTVLDIQAADICYISYGFNCSLLTFLKGLLGEILPVLYGLFMYTDLCYSSRIFWYFLRKPLYCFPILTERSLYWRFNLCLLKLIWSTSRCFQLRIRTLRTISRSLSFNWDDCLYSFWSSSLIWYWFVFNPVLSTQLFQKYCVRSIVSVPMQGFQCQEPPLPQPHLSHRQAQPGGEVPAWICSMAAYRFSCLDDWCLLLNKTYKHVAPSSSFWHQRANLFEDRFRKIL